MTQTLRLGDLPAFGFADTKPHYQLLDGLRGVAALLVVFNHVFEGYAFASSVNGVGDGTIVHLNHGYLAVDFFFPLLTVAGSMVLAWVALHFYDIPVRRWLTSLAGHRRRG